MNHKTALAGIPTDSDKRGNALAPTRTRRCRPGQGHAPPEARFSCSVQIANRSASMAPTVLTNQQHRPVVINNCCAYHTSSSII